MEAPNTISQIIVLNEDIRNEIMDISSYYNGSVTEDKMIDISLMHPGDIFTIRTSHIGSAFYYDSVFLNGKVDRKAMPINN